MTMHARPIDPVDSEYGHGELIRAQRLYMGLSQRELARTIPMDRRTYQRIEGGTEPCPPGFLDTMTRLVDVFDREVEDTIATAVRMIAGSGLSTQSGQTGSVHFRVCTDDDPAHVWTRAVIGRAAVESGLITPTLDSDMEAQSA